MDKKLTNSVSDSRWDARFFIIAGSLLLINTLFLWIRHYSNYQLSILWPAIPAISGLACSVFGLLKLYPRVTVHSPLIAKGGAGFALLALVSLSFVALWVFVVSVFGEGMQKQQSQWLMVLIALFMLAMIVSFFMNAVAFLTNTAQRKVGYLLTVPLAMWFIMLVVGVIKGMEKGLSLDFYTNPIIAIAFMALGYTFKQNKSSNN